MKLVHIFLFVLLKLCCFTNLNAASASQSDSSINVKSMIKFDLNRLMTSEINISYEHFLNDKYSLQFYLANLYANDAFNGIAQHDWNSMLFLFHGYSFTSSIRRYKKSVTVNNHKFIEISLSFRYRFFYDREFQDGSTGNDPLGSTPIIYRMNNIQTLSGLSVKKGRRVKNIEFYAGIGFRYIHRQITVLSCYDTGNPNSHACDRNWKPDLYQLTLHLGINVILIYVKKNKA